MKKDVTMWGKGNAQGHDFPLNLQLFADGDGAGDDGDGAQEPRTYTEEDFNKALQSEADKRVTEALKTAQAKWQAEYEAKVAKERDEAAALAKLSAEERAKKQLENQYGTQIYETIGFPFSNGEKQEKVKIFITEMLMVLII